MISQMRTERGYKVVTRVWAWNDDAKLTIGLTEAPMSFEIGGGLPARVNGRPGQRALLQDTASGVSQLSFAWEQDGLYFSINGTLKDRLNEAEILKVIASIQHLP